jgi:hypothetical protein
MSTAEEQLAAKDAEIKKIKQYAFCSLVRPLLGATCLLTRYVAKKLKESKDELDKSRGDMDALRDHLTIHGVRVAPDLQSPPSVDDVEAQVWASTLD